MKTLIAVLSLVTGAAIAAPGKPYWVPMIAPDGQVYELEILPTDAEGATVIMCVPGQLEMTFRCLAKRDGDGAYGFLTVVVPMKNGQT